VQILIEDNLKIIHRDDFISEIRARVNLGFDFVQKNSGLFALDRKADDVDFFAAVNPSLVEIIRVWDLQPQVCGICGDDTYHERLGGIPATDQEQLFIGFRGVVELGKDFLLCRE